MKISFSSLSKYRAQLMGVATLMIIMCHANPYGVQLPRVLSRIFSYGNIGVDIFLFVSGVGLTYSLDKVKFANFEELWQWYRRRYVRILLPYLLISLTILPLKTWLDTDGNWLRMLCDVTTLPFWTHHRSAWFVALLIPLYLLTPLFYRVIISKSIRKTIVGGGILIAISQVLSMYHPVGESDIWHNITFCLCRTTSFFAGMTLTPLVKSDKRVNVLYVLCSFLPLYGVCHKICPEHTFQILQALPILALISWIFEHMPKESYIYNLLAWFGTLSLESYLCNVYLCAFTKQMGIHSYILVVVAGITLSLIYQWLGAAIIHKIK